MRKTTYLFLAVLLFLLGGAVATDANAARIKCLVADQANSSFEQLCTSSIPTAFSAPGDVVDIDTSTLEGGTPITEAELTGYDMVVIGTVFGGGGFPAVRPIHWPVIREAIRKRLSPAFWILADACCGVEALQASIDITNEASGGLFALTPGSGAGVSQVNLNPESNFRGSFASLPQITAAFFTYFSGAPIGYVLYGQGTTASQIGAANEEVLLPRTMSFGGTGACIMLGSDVNLMVEYPAQQTLLAQAHYAAAQPGGSCDATPPDRPTLSLSVTPSLSGGGGGTTRLTVTLGNTNATSLALQTALMNLPSGVVLANPANASTTCTDASGSASATLTASAGGNSLSLPSDSRIPLGGCTIDVDLAVSPGSYELVLRAADVLTSAGLAVGDAALIVGSTPLPPTTALSLNPTQLPAVGGNSRLTLALGNPNAYRLTVSAMLLTLPAGLVAAATPNATSTCTNNAGSGQAVPQATAGGSSVSLLAGTRIPPGGCEVSIDLSAPAGSYPTRLAAADVVTNGGPPASDAFALLSSAPTQAPTTALSLNPSSIVSGAGPSRLTLTVGNANAGVLRIASLAMALPPGVRLAAPVNAVTTCTDTNGQPSASVSAIAGGSTIGLPAGTTIAPGGCTVAVDVVADPGSFTLRLAVADLQTDGGAPAIDVVLTLLVASAAQSAVPIPIGGPVLVIALPLLMLALAIYMQRSRR